MTAAQDLVTRSCAKQGITEQISDPVVIATVARIITASPRQKAS